MRLDLTLDLALASRVPVLVWGRLVWARRRHPGLGGAEKASLLDRRCESAEPADFGGLPIVDLDGHRTDGELALPRVTFVPPRFAIEAASEGGVIFLDELTTAPPAVQAALLRAVVDHTFGDLELDPSRVAIIAAANPPADAAGGWDLAPPLANRFAHVHFELSPNEWTEAFPGYWVVLPICRSVSRHSTNGAGARHDHSSPRSSGRDRRCSFSYRLMSASGRGLAIATYLGLRNPSHRRSRTAWHRSDRGAAAAGWLCW